MKILVFDMDGVLLEPLGYHQALQETVQLLGTALGFQNLSLKREEIFRFESAGISSEWDSSAICLALMMREVWKIDPGAEVPRILDQGSSAHGPVKFLGWDQFLDQIESKRNPESDPLQLAQEILVSGLDFGQSEKVCEILKNAHDPDQSLSFRTFQELVLGSQMYQNTYQISSVMNVPGTLCEYDRSQLTSETRLELNNWLSDSRKAVICTNRPNLPPGGQFGSPEAEQGAKLVGLEHLPLVGYGDMNWLAGEYQQPVDELRKPAPVHVLAALLRTAGASQPEALHSAAGLVQHNLVDEKWKDLDGSEWFVLEDTTSGMVSAVRASGLLEELGIRCRVHLIGITPDPKKKGPLEKLGAEIFTDLEQALQTLVLD
jgi:hypothetical protein